MRRPDVRDEADRILARRSPRAVSLFGHIFARALARDFHAVRLSASGARPDPGLSRPVVYANHPSWWDAAVFVLLGRTLFAGRAGYAPIDARMLGRYGFFPRIGAFGIEPGTRRGAALFLAAATRILERPERLLVVTGQGRFADARERPVVLRQGLAHLAERVPMANFVPLALEYAFWDERRPELLIRFGAPIPAATLLGVDRARRTILLAKALEEAMDALAAEAIARDPRAFDTLVMGRAGVGGIYDAWRRARALLRGERFVARHGERP